MPSACAFAAAMGVVSAIAFIASLTGSSNSYPSGAAVIYRVTFGFAGGSVGWSETHACISGSNDPGALAQAMRDIAAKRAQMLGGEFAIVAIRIARYSNDAGVRQRGVKLINETFRNSNAGSQGWGAEPAQVALMVRGDSAASQVNPGFDANENQTFLGGPIDDCVDQGGQVYPGRRNLGSAFATWKAAMINSNMGWLASQTILDVPLVEILPNDNGTVQFTTTAGLIPTITAGQTYRARIRRVNGGVSPLNGEIIVTCVDNDTLVSYEIIGLALAQVGGRIRIYKQVQPFVAYGDLLLGERAGNHKRGRPFGSKPGRARRRIRG